MTDTAETRTLVIEREMPHPPEKIWRALTEGALIEEWLMSNDFKPVVGHRFTFRATPVPNWNGVIECEVLAVEPNARLAYSGTHLRMEQSGFGPNQDANYKGANYGWQKFLGNLERVVERMD